MALLSTDRANYGWERLCADELRSCRLGDIVVIACLYKGQREVISLMTGELVGCTVARAVGEHELKSGVAEISLELLERAGGRVTIPYSTIDDERYDWYIRIIG